MKTFVEPYIDSIKKTGYLDVGEADFQIYYEKYKVPGSKASIVLSHGYTESAEKFHEMIYYYIQEGYSVYVLEHRGYGRSGHLGVKDATQVNIDDFNYYISDLKKFVDKIVKPATHGQKLFLYAHSMGGAIGARFLEEHPDDFDAAILTAPMLEIDTGKIPSWITSILANASVALSFGDNYIAGQGPYNPEYDFEGTATGCEVRYSYYRDIELAIPEIQRGGGSYKWLQQCMLAGKEAVKKENAQKVTIPVMLFQAGKDDLVKPGAQNKFAQYAANCTLFSVDGAEHEIYRECDGILKPYLDKVLSFYAENL